jgi:beta-glucanase (GH16 family)
MTFLKGRQKEDYFSKWEPNGPLGVRACKYSAVLPWWGDRRAQDPNTVNVTAHSNATGTHTMQSTAVNVPSTDGFHNYGVLWDKDQIVWYFDDVAVAHANTPSDMHKPMYMLVDLAVGGVAGTPANGLDHGSDLKIDYIHAYTLNDPATTAAQHIASAGIAEIEWRRAILPLLNSSSVSKSGTMTRKTIRSLRAIFGLTVAVAARILSCDSGIRSKHRQCGRPCDHS